MAFGARIYNTNSEVLIDDIYPTMVAKQQGTLDAWQSNYAVNSKGYYEYDCGTPWQDIGYYLDTVYTEQDPYDPATDGPNPPTPANPNPWIMGHKGYCTVYGPTPLDNSIYDNPVLMFVRLRVGHNIQHFLSYGGAGKGDSFVLNGFWSTDPVQEYALVTPRSLLPNPTGGYGMAIYRDDGVCMWDAETAIGHIAGATGFLPWKTPFNHTDGAEWVCIGPLATGSQYVPNSYDGSQSASVRVALKRNSTSQIELIETERTYYGNSGGDANARPIGGSLLIGKF